MKIVKLGTLLLISVSLCTAAFADTKDAKKDPNAKPYPLKTCVVSGEKLGEMGDPYVFTYKGQEFKLCCKSCNKDFKKDPAKYVKKLEEEVKKAKK